MKRLDPIKPFLLVAASDLLIAWTRRTAHRLALLRTSSYYFQLQDHTDNTFKENKCFFFVPGNLWERMMNFYKAKKKQTIQRIEQNIHKASEQQLCF